jgi:CubicO group peptidase (beta-lactamase class C family)
MSPSIPKTLVLLLAAGVLHGQADWPTAKPEAEGFSSSKLSAWKDALAAQKTTGLLVIRHDRIVYEWYAPDWGASKPHGTASMAKALVGGTSLLVALNDGRLGVDDLASKYIPGWRQDPRKSKITIRQLATHSSGIEDAEQDEIPHMDLPGWKGDFWRRKPDPFTVTIHSAPVIFEPGTRFEYSNPGMAALAYAVTASLKNAPQKDIRSLLKERVMDPLGVPERDWNIGYGTGYEVDGLKLYANWGRASYTARATARVGQMMLHHGKWNGRQLLEAKWVDRMVAFAHTPIPDRTHSSSAAASGLGWWTNFDGVWPAVPRDAFAGAGAGHQIVAVVPSLDLIVVRNGELMSDDRKDSGFFGAPERYLLNPLMAALQTGPPMPHSPVIRKISFAPESAIVRDAIESDNWPITWGDDDHQYTSYGDGWGFQPLTDIKLSMGFARIEGAATAFHGINIRSQSGERTGNGAAGPKASGMLMVNGVLYMWVRNTGNSQLAWSEDHGRTWNWGFRFDTSFGSPTFLNFGKNYQGARDGYVYTYSQDGPSAYESSDGVVLARVPKDRIRERSAYEFFAGLQESGQPAWTADIAKRRGVLNYPGRCQRTDVVYNAGIRRYMMALGYNHGGAWGIFDAPEPWGPWTSAFHTESWGLGDTHGYRLPAKWIAADGRRMYLVFSGVKLPDITYDAFCVREMTLEMDPGPGMPGPYR